MDTMKHRRITVTLNDGNETTKELVINEIDGIRYEDDGKVVKFGRSDYYGARWRELFAAPLTSISYWQNGPAPRPLNWS